MCVRERERESVIVLYRVAVASFDKKFKNTKENPNCLARVEIGALQGAAAAAAAAAVVVVVVVVAVVAVVVVAVVAVVVVAAAAAAVVVCIVRH